MESLVVLCSFIRPFVRSFFLFFSSSGRYPSARARPPLQDTGRYNYFIRMRRALVLLHNTPPGERGNKRKCIADDAPDSYENWPPFEGRDESRRAGPVDAGWSRVFAPRMIGRASDTDESEIRLGTLGVTTPPSLSELEQMANDLDAIRCDDDAKRRTAGVRRDAFDAGDGGSGNIKGRSSASGTGVLTIQSLEQRVSRMLDAETAPAAGGGGAAEKDMGQFDADTVAALQSEIAFLNRVSMESGEEHARQLESLRSYISHVESELSTAWSTIDRLVVECEAWEDEVRTSRSAGDGHISGGREVDKKESDRAIVASAEAPSRASAESRAGKQDKDSVLQMAMLIEGKTSTDACAVESAGPAELDGSSGRDEGEVDGGSERNSVALFTEVPGRAPIDEVELFVNSLWDDGQPALSLLNDDDGEEEEDVASSSGLDANMDAILDEHRFVLSSLLGDAEGEEDGRRPNEECRGGDEGESCAPRADGDNRRPRAAGDGCTDGEAALFLFYVVAAAVALLGAIALMHGSRATQPAPPVLGSQLPHPSAHRLESTPGWPPFAMHLSDGLSTRSRRSWSAWAWNGVSALASNALRFLSLVDDDLETAAADHLNVYRTMVEEFASSAPERAGRQPAHRAVRMPS